MEERDGDSAAKRRRHFEGKPFATSTPVRSVQTVEPPYLSIDDMDATSYKAYKARKQLAAIDWNFHLNQPEATTKAGDAIVTRKYNQRTKEWNSKVVKVTKGYEYIVMLMARILRLRREDAERVTRNVPLDDSDPALLAPTIAPKPPPPSKELYLAKRSRFTKTTSSEESSAQISCETETTSELA